MTPRRQLMTLNYSTTTTSVPSLSLRLLDPSYYTGKERCLKGSLLSEKAWSTTILLLLGST